MKKITTIVAVLFAATNLFSQVTFTRMWERSDSAFTETSLVANQKPSYLDANTRGIAYGNINSNTGMVERFFLVSRSGEGNVVRVLDAATGTSIKSMDNTGIAGGGFPISDIGITEDGVLLVSNCTHSSSGPFKIYKYTSEDAQPIEAISFPSGAIRYGDKITVTGRYSDGTARIYTIGGTILTNYKVQYFGMEQLATNWQFKQTPSELNTNITAAVSNFHQFTPGPDGGFYFRSVGLNDFQQFKADLTANIGNTHPTSIAQGGTTPVFIKTVGGFDYACYLRYGSGAFSKLANNLVEVVKIDRSIGISSAIVVASTPSLGKTAPGNGAGHVAVKLLPNGDVDIFVLSSINGIARYKLTGFTTGVENTKTDNIRLITTKNQLTVEGVAVSSVEIFNSLGQKVKSENRNIINTAGLQGIYLVNIKEAGITVKTVKVLLK
ncbi:MAG: hypothetical protein GZ091_11200 [Paludibacter sp.]|nr:hypothetical protein [Paludibacter sp.]